MRIVVGCWDAGFLKFPPLTAGADSSPVPSNKSEIQEVEELVSMLAPHQTPGQAQKLMLNMIRAKEVDQGLWETYVILIKKEQAILHQ